MNNEIKTAWGKLSPQVDLFPLIYLFFIYGLVYIFPYGRNIIGMSWFDWLRSEDGPLEWLQFLGYFSAFILSSITLWKKKSLFLKKSWLAWLVLTLVCFVNFF